MKTTLLSSMLLIALALAACGKPASGAAAAPTRADDLPTETRIAIGTLQLEGSEQAVSAKQAGDLLVLWQVYLDLAGSDTAAQDEIDGLAQQIQETMTAEQMKSITAMNLTQQDVLAVIQEQDPGLDLSQRSSNDTTSSFAPAAGGGPPDGGGGPPPDAVMGGDMGGMGAVAPDNSKDLSQGTTTGQGTRANEGVPTALVRVLIQYLEGKAGS